MLAAMSNGDDQHVRALLEQRAHRADVVPHHTRYSAFSDRSDSPSLYSHFDNNYRNTAAPPTPSPRSPFHDRDASNDLHVQYTPRTPHSDLPLHIPYASHPPQEANQPTRSESPEDSTLDLGDESDDDDDETRMSLLGPKISVHSRAPWEEDIESASGDIDFNGNDTQSILGVKKSGIRALGFGNKSPMHRPSFESVNTYKGKTSIDVISSGPQASTSRSAIHALAQSSMSSTSLALGPSPSSTRQTTWSRERTLSNNSYPNQEFSSHPFPGQHSPVSELISGRISPLPQGRRSASPHRPEFARSLNRSPSPLSSETDHSYMHPYANPALVSAYDPEPPPRKLHEEKVFRQAGLAAFSRNDSVATLAASEETVTMSHSSTAISANSYSIDSSGTPHTSGYSIIAAASQPDLSKSLDADKSKHPKRDRRDTKIGPISAPAIATAENFEATKPYTLISLEQAQARVKERNRSATLGSAQNESLIEENKELHTKVRARSSSATEKGRQVITHALSADGKIYGTINASDGVKHTMASSGKVIRPKRSGFMKLFNAREREKPHDIPLPPIPTNLDGGGASRRVDQSSYPHPPTPRQTVHRVPVPPSDGLSTPYSSTGKEALPSRKAHPPLSINVSSPSAIPSLEHDSVARRSDSPKSSLRPPLPQQMPSSAPASRTEFAELKLRPISGFFSSSFAEHVIGEELSPESSRGTDPPSLISPTSIASSDYLPSPLNSSFMYAGVELPPGSAEDDQTAIITALKEQIRQSRKAWQRQIWELEGQVRDLKAEIEDMKNGEVCEVCGRGPTKSETNNTKGVIHRPRAKTGCGARFASGNEV